MFTQQNILRDMKVLSKLKKKICLFSSFHTDLSYFTKRKKVAGKELIYYNGYFL